MSETEGSPVEAVVSESVLEAVTVQDGGAEVRRRLTLPGLKPGPVKLSLLGLVDGAKDLQLHVLDGPASLRLLSLPLRYHHYDDDDTSQTHQPPSHKDQLLKDQLLKDQLLKDQAIKDQIADLDTRLKILKETQGEYEQVKNKVMAGWLENYEPEDEASPENGVKEAFKAFGRAKRVYEDEVGPIKTEATALTKAKAELEKQLVLSMEEADRKTKLAKAEAERKTKLAKAEAERKKKLRQRAVTAALEVVGEGPQEVVLGLTYQVDQAGWTPFYVLRETSGTERLRLTFLAEVSQQSGEEWRGAKLLLSSARADRFAAFERPAPFHVVHRGGQKRRASTYDPNYQTLAGLGDDDMLLPKKAFVPRAARPMARAASGEGEKLTGTTRFELFDKPTIPSSSALRHQVVVAELELDAELGWDTTPTLSTSVFRVAKATNTATHRLPAGPVNVYFDAAFVSKTRLKDVRAGESFSVSLGEDASLGLERKVPETTKSTDLASKTTSERHSQRMAVRNGREKEVILRLQESIPLYQLAAVVVAMDNPKVGKGGVEETDAGTGDRAWLDEDHVLHWHIRLPPKGYRDLRLAYTVTAPLPEPKTPVPKKQDSVSESFKE